jgi:uncharacterized protein YndB with AHSA1/START domain
MSVTETPVTSVSVDTHVDAPAEHCFRVFTEGIGSWWDPDHHLLDSELVSMTFEPWVGGNIVDQYADGRECRWARVLTYDPPRRVVFSWDITTDWEVETDPDRTSEVEVTFTAVGPDRTHVVLVHRNLDRHGESWQSMRDGVSRGWSLDRYAEVAAAQQLG